MKVVQNYFLFKYSKFFIIASAFVDVFWKYFSLKIISLLHIMKFGAEELFKMVAWSGWMAKSVNSCKMNFIVFVIFSGIFLSVF